jgi:hypothetical protein
MNKNTIFDPVSGRLNQGPVILAEAWCWSWKDCFKCGFSDKERRTLWKGIVHFDGSPKRNKCAARIGPVIRSI